jgi:hypothetical protein
MSESQSQSSQECRVLLFPLHRQAARVGDTARRLIRKRSASSADRECSRIADEMFARLDRLGLCEAEQEEAVGAFFHVVECELVRLAQARSRPCRCSREA